jgi:hypothetical protein
MDTPIPRLVKRGFIHFARRSNSTRAIPLKQVAPSARNPADHQFVTWIPAGDLATGLACIVC